MPLHTLSSPATRPRAVFRGARPIVKRFPLMGLAAMCLHTGFAAPDARAQERRSMGITAGVPQTVAFTFEAPLWKTLRVQGNLGTIFLYSSACTRVLWVDDALRQVVVAEAKLAVDKAKQAHAAQQQVDAAASGAANGNAAPPASPATKTPASEEDVAKKLEDARQQVQAIGRTALPLVPPTLWPEAGWKFLWHVPGFLLTALAACLGAPFWFDVLNKAINLRLAGTATPKKK